MIKKRRDTIIDLTKEKKTIINTISTKTDTSNVDGVIFTKHEIIPKYGTGFIKSFKTNNISLCISKFQLNNDLTFYKSLEEELIQISFLLEGEKIILNKDYNENIFESGESFMADIEGFEGSIKILSNRPVKEVKINIKKSFLIDHGFIKNTSDLKKMTDKNLILPITDKLLQILIQLEENNLKGLTNKIFLHAKVLEILALKILSYQNNKEVRIGKEKIIKQIYLVKQIIKSNLDKNYSLADLTSKTGINGHEFNKEFIRVNKCSIYEFSISEKMKHAKYLLENTKNMIYSIADEVGYKNSTHFTNAFKRTFHITPLNYRKKQKLN